MPMALILLQKRSCSHPELGFAFQQGCSARVVRNLPEVFRLLQKKASADTRKLKNHQKGEPASTVNRQPLLSETSVRAF